MLNLFFRRTTIVGDFYDRLVSVYTPVVLLVYAAVVQIIYIFQHDLAITCWTPDHFSFPMIDFTNKECWATPLYYMFRPDSNARDDARQQLLNIHPWIPLILALVSLFMAWPSLVWKFLSWQAGHDICNIVGKAMQLEHNAENSKKKAIFEDMADRTMALGCLKSFRGMTNIFRTIFSNYLPFLYVLTKFSYMSTVIVLIIFSNLLLVDYGVVSASGASSLPGEISNRIYHVSFLSNVSFENRVLCDLQVMRLSNVQRYTVQCSLPLAGYHLRLFLLLRIWFIILLVLTFFSFVAWVVWLIVSVVVPMMPGKRRGEVTLVERSSNPAASYGPSMNAASGRLLWTHIGANAILAKEMVKCNAGRYAAKQLVAELRKKLAGNENQGNTSEL